MVLRAGALPVAF